MISSPMKFLLLALVVLFLFPLDSGMVLADEPTSSLTFVPSKCQNFACSSDGKTLAAKIVSDKKLEANAPLGSVGGPGWYRLAGEYQTSGMERMGIFVIDIAGMKVLPWQGYPASSGWSPFQVYFKTEGTSAGSIRLIGEPKQVRASGSGEIQLRNLQLSPYVMSDGQELLGNPDFSFGKIGELPSQWTWNYFGRSGDYVLVADKSFQAGNQTLRILSENVKDGRTIVSSKLPMPAPGRLSFSIWGRSDDAQMTMVLYLIGSDYQWLKTINVPLTPVWTKHTLEADVPEGGQAIYFSPRIDIKGTGAANLAGASLVWRSKQPAGNQPSSGKNSGGGNLLSNPDMELGFQGWYFDFFMPSQQPLEAIRQIRGEECRFIPGVGVDNSTALLVTPRHSLVSHCVPISQGATYTCSAYLKSTSPSGNATLFMIDPGWKIYSKNIKDIPSDRWQRYSFTFVWDKPTVQKKAYIRIDPGTSAVMVDRVQIQEGPLTDYQSPAVMLGIRSARQVYDPRQTIEGWTAEMILRSGTAMPEVELHIKDAWGRSLEPVRRLAFSGLRSSVPLSELPSDRLGSYRLTLIAKDAAGKVLAESESRYVVLDQPASAILPTGLPLFSICHEASFPLWMDRELMALYRRMGPGLNRFFLANDLMADAGYQAVLKDQLELQRQNGIQKIIGQFDLTKEQRAMVDAQDEMSPEVLQAIAKYLRRIVPPMKNQIRYWEILNEGNIWRYDQGPRKGQRSMRPEKYVPILKKAYETIKAIDPSLQVVGICLSGADYDYVRACMELGAGKYMDIYSWHAYRHSPDMPDTYADLMKMKALMKEYGFHGPTINGEQYYSANLHMFHNHDEEVRRQYIVGEKEEMWATGRVMQNYIHHAAAEVPWAVFAPGSNLLKFGGHDRLFVYDAMPAYNAATRLLGNAGPGQPVRLSGDSRAFFFPDAREGPLLVMYTLLPEFNGHMKVASLPMNVYDMMGNPIEQKTIARDGIPMQVSPVYVRLPLGTSLDQLQQSLSQASITGLGEPFNMRLTILPDGRLGVVVTNRMNQPASGKVALRDYPQDWRLQSDQVDFGPLSGGTSTTVAFTGQVPIRVMGQYGLTAVASSQQKFTRQELRFSPIFASKADAAMMAGEMDTKADWIDLGLDHLSPNYAADRPYGGASDLSARMALSWDTDGLLLVVAVTDDVAYFPAAPGDYNGDSIQIYFDQKNNAENPRSLYDSDDVTYHVGLVGGKPMAVVEKGIDGRFLGAANQTTGLDPDVKTTIARQGNQTLYRIYFPAKCLPSVDFRQGSLMGFSILINDNDGKGRKTGLTLAPKGQEPYNHPYDYRTLIFR